MSDQITTAFVQEYKATVQQLAQQMESRLVRAVSIERQNSKIAFYDQIDKTTAVKRTQRHGDTPRVDTPHKRRALVTSFYEWADLIDKYDMIRTLNEFTNPYVQAATFALNRAKDEEIIAALGGTARTGEDGSSTASLASGNKVSISEGGNNKFNYDKFRAAQGILKAKEAWNEGTKVYVVFDSTAEKHFMDETEVVNSDYNNQRIIDNGGVRTFGTAEFIRTELIANFNGSTGTDRKCYMFTDQAIKLGLGMDINARITERDDKSYSTQVYAALDCGAVRMQEDHVVEIPYNPAA